MKAQCAHHNIMYTLFDHFLHFEEMVYPGLRFNHLRNALVEGLEYLPILPAARTFPG
jgi:hypothetical protein